MEMSQWLAIVFLLLVAARTVVNYDYDGIVYAIMAAVIESIVLCSMALVLVATVQVAFNVDVFNLIKE